MTLEIVNTDADEKARLRFLISELTERMVDALEKPQGSEPSEGKETATFSDIRAALGQICDVYRLLHGTGDLDKKSGSALTELERKFHAKRN